MIPKIDSGVLFTTSGMHPLIPYLLGEPHQKGTRLMNLQRCLRTGDIEEVGDKTHLTFFEMLGNWSLGDYFKKESLTWSLQFLEQLGIDKNKLGVSVYQGDTESLKIWQDLGIKHIEELKEDNWWGPVYQNGPCGPCSEIFYWNSNQPLTRDLSDPSWVEIWNNVFMSFDKEENDYNQLKQRNVDTGMGLERMLMILENKSSVFETELFGPCLEESSSSSRLLIDHLRSISFLVMDEVVPSNKNQGYVLRRLIRSCLREKEVLEEKNLEKVISQIIHLYKERYPLLKDKEERVKECLQSEEKKFSSSLKRGIKHLEKENKNIYSGKDLYYMQQSFGFFPEFSIKEIERLDKKIENNWQESYRQEKKEHQRKSSL